MQISFWKQGIVLVVIMLFLGVAFAPGITASREIVETKELNNDLVEITIEVGNQAHTVLLTHEQAMELENLIAWTKTRLDTVTTREETARIFDDTVVSLYELGMLPEDMSIEDTQRLVNGYNRFSRINTLLDSLGGGNPGIFDNQTNVLCLIAGETDKDHTEIFGRPIYVFILVTMLLNIFSKYSIFPHFTAWYLGFFWFFLTEMLTYGDYIKQDLHIPLSLADAISLGFLSFYYEIIPASGWVHTIGLNGMKRWEGDLYGNLPPSGTFSCFGPFEAVYGFFGIKIIKDNEYFYLGTAVWVKIGEEPPIGV